MNNDAILHFDDGAIPCPPGPPAPQQQAEKLRELLLDIVDEALAEKLVTVILDGATDKQIPTAAAVLGRGYMTAYSYAKQAGYTGTEGEFAALMANYAVVGAQAAQSAEDAQTASESAADSAEAAAQSADDAEAAAQNAADSAEDAAQSASDARLFMGAPLVAQTADAMTDDTRVYVYVGSEEGYVSGNWYYYDGSAWTSGGVYNAAAVQTDDKLLAERVPADAAAAGTGIRTASSRIDGLEDDLTQPIRNAFTTVGATAGYRLRVSNGQAVASSTFSYTDYIPVRPGDVVMRNWNADSSTYGDVFYKADKTFLNGRGSASNYAFTVPEDAAYIRLTYKTSAASTLKLLILSQTKNRAQGGKEDALRETIEHVSGGHMRMYGGDYAIQCYRDNGGTAEQSNIVAWGTDYIPIQSSDYLYVLPNPGEKNATLKNDNIAVYFYDADKNVIWTDFDYTNSSNLKNVITTKALRERNGLLFAGVSAAYVRVGRALYENAPQTVVVWDGEQVGGKVFATPKIFGDASTIVTNPAGGAGSILAENDALLLVAKPGYTFLDVWTASSGAVSHPSDAQYRVPSQILSLQNMAGSSRHKNVTIVKGYDYDNGTYEAVQLNGDISPYVSMIYTGAVTGESPTGWARMVLDNIKAVMKLSWTAQKELISNNGVTTFKAGVQYNGAPYRSGWGSAHFVGWHVTKHTLINAADDPDSIFYENPSKALPGPYYSLVCSSAASLVCGFRYPVTNYSMMRDPNIDVTPDDQAEICTLHTNGHGHCLVPVFHETTWPNRGDGYSATVYFENGAPTTRLASAPNGINTDWQGIGYNYQHGRSYFYRCVPQKRLGSIPYDIESGSLTHGSARPNKGDRSVYTSVEDVVINIKDPSANRLYYQKFNVTCTNGRPGAFTAAGDAQYVTIQPGTTQHVLRSATEDGAYTGELLESGAVYGVWTSVDSSQTSAPAATEYFEWHDVELEAITYDVVDGALVTDDEFWYAATMGINYEWWVRSEKKGGWFIIPYQEPGYNADGTPKEHSDYSNYAARARLRNRSSVKAFFRKGKFGAYVVGMQVEDEHDDDDEPEAGG